MPLKASITVDATVTLRDLLERIAGESAAMYVTVRRFEYGQTYWYVWSVDDLRRIGDGASDQRLDQTLTEALDLHEGGATDAYDAAEAGDYSDRYGVLVRGDEAVGVLRPEGGSRGGGPQAAPPPMMANGGAGAAAGREADRRPFSAYPSLTAPEIVDSEQAFSLDIGLAADAVPGVSGGPITITAPERFVFDLQVVADGFAFPNGSKATLDVTRDDFQNASVSVDLVAPQVEAGPGFRGTIEVLFTFEGNLCGRAERAITVTAGGDAMAPVTTTGASSVSVPDAPAPDLTVMISDGADDTTLVWTFTSPHPLQNLPAVPVPRKFNNQTALSFALDKVRRLAEWDKTSLSAAQFVGVGEEISATMPNEFWVVLDEVWALTKAAGNVPSVLIVSKDPYVPWELAAITDNYAPPGRVDDTKPVFLGAQVNVGKWVPPVSTPFGGDIPTLPPVIEAEVGDMLLFVGDYEAIQGNRPLPLAEEEGKKLALRYDAIERNAVINDVTDLVRDELENNGNPVKVDAIHFACHGEVSADPKHNGIVLADSGLRLGADMISGSSIGKTSNPFVFLNACQLGTETRSLDGNYGGMAGAFLSQGATGFISPLWSVDDDIAQEVALDFYKQVYEEDRPVAEVLSELRSRFNADSSSPRASYLAYVYYGHPNLVINKL